MPQTPGGGGGDPGLVAAIADAFNISKAKAANLVQQAMAATGGGTFKEIATWINNNAKPGGNTPDGPPNIPDFTNPDGGGGGGGGGGSGASGPDPAALRAAYVGILHSWGIPASAVAGLVNQAVSGDWTSSQFVNHLRQTKAYKEHFHGIGSQPGMSESSYLSQYRQYKALAQDIGRGLSRQAFGTLLRKGIDYREWAFRIKVEEQIDKNHNLWDWYERELRKRGELKPSQHLTRSELKDIVTKQNSKRFESIYQTAFLQSNLQKIGFDLFKGPKGGAGVDLSRKGLLRMINQFEAAGLGQEIEALKPADFADLAEQIRTTIPASKLYGFGISKKDLLELKLGGPNAQKIGVRAQNALKQAQAATEDRNQAQLVQTEKGTKLLTGGLSGDEGY